jgi:aerobic-type carbon monoxide dehydrogenase small subunit (CoxS/CutS family)
MGKGEGKEGGERWRRRRARSGGGGGLCGAACVHIDGRNVYVCVPWLRVVSGEAAQGTKGMAQGVWLDATDTAGGALVLCGYVGLCNK